MNRRRGKGTSTAVPVVFLIAFSLLVLAGIAILVTSDREPPPPVSTMTYEPRPDGRPARDPMPSFPRDRRGPQSPEAPVTLTSATTDAPSEAEDPSASLYAITGTVTDAIRGEGVADVRLLASRVPTEEEQAEYNEKDRLLVASGDTEGLDALIAEKKRIWADAGTHTDADGQFRIPIAHAGEYTITVIPQNFLRESIDKRFVGESSPEWKVDIALKVGATISGRITDSFDNGGIAGIRVNTTLASENVHHQTITDEDGNYSIAGLAPGDYNVLADIERTAYRVTKVLPFRKTRITSPDEEVKNIDFKLDKGGVVWGYVTTPENEPVASHVILCTSESVISQALSAMIKQAPPLGDNSSKEDGYYELVGVPLNEEWRLYATSDSNAPQLAEPFIITPRNKEVRVDITMFDGTDVYGQVVDQKGKGVSGARVMCVPSYTQLMAPMESAQAMREVTSDDDGFFELNELPASNYQVMAHKDGFKIALRGTPLYANGYHDVKNFRVVLEGIEAGNYKVYGTVTDAVGQAVPEARVVLSGIGTESLQGVGRDGYTDNSGDFEFEGVEIGTYVLNVTKGGYSAKTVNKVLLDEQNDVILEAAAIVRGRVLAQSTNKAPENGYSVSAVQLSGSDEESGRNLFSLLSDMDEGERLQEFNDPEGHYELSLASGTWRLEGRATPLAPGRKEISLLPGDVIENVDLILTSEGSSIEGYLRISDGQSPQGANVFLVEADSPSQALTLFAQSGSGQYSTQVAEDGAFLFERLPAGTYYAVARHPAYPQAMSEAIYLEADDDAAGVEILMGPGGSLEGFVYDGGRPVSGWIVTVIANGQPYTGTSGQNGAYEVQNIPEGTFQAFAANPSLTMNLEGLTGQGYPVTIWSGSVTYHNFGEFEGITVLVQVNRASGNPLIPSGLENIGARVYLNPASNIPVIGEGLDGGQIPGDAYTLAGQTASIPNVGIGGWRVDYYELERTGTYRWRAMQDFEVTGDEPEVIVDLFVN